MGSFDDAAFDIEAFDLDAWNFDDDIVEEPLRRRQEPAVCGQVERVAEWGY